MQLPVFRRLSFLGRWRRKSPTPQQLATTGWYLVKNHDSKLSQTTTVAVESGPFPLADRYLLESPRFSQSPASLETTSIICSGCGILVMLDAIGNPNEHLQSSDEIVRLKFHLYHHEQSCPFFLHNIPEYVRQVIPSVYSPLSDREIRLFVLNPGLGDALLEGTLMCAPLDDPFIKYEALSYTWGIPILRAPIILNGYWFAATVSLVSVLRRLRKAEEPRALWIDALCINQNDITERSQQVSIMGEIYKCCQECMIWLGGYNERGIARLQLGTDKTVFGPRLPTKPEIFPDEHETVFHGDHRDDHLLEVLEQEQNDFARVPHHQESWTEIQWDFDKVITEPEKEYIRAFAFLRLLYEEVDITQVPFIRSENGDSLFSASWHRCAVAVRDIFFRHWWQRVWTMQEAVLAPKATVLLGNISIPLSILQAVLILWRNPQRIRPWIDALGEVYMSQFWYSPTQNANMLATLRRDYRTREIGGMLDLLCTLAKRTATDPRDYIYGLLSLFPTELVNNPVQPLKPDYAKTTREVFIQAAVTMMYVDNTLDHLLVKDGRVNSKVEGLNLPSWVPNWGRIDNNGGEWNAHFMTARASGNKLASFTAHLDPELPQLAVSAHPVGRVVFIGRPCYFGIETAQEVGKVLDSWREGMRRVLSKLDSNPELVEEMFLRMLVGDITLGQSLEDPPVQKAGRRDLDLVTQLIAELRKDANEFLGNGRSELQSLFWERVKPVCASKVFFVTDEGLIGLAPEVLVEGDGVFIIMGARAPLALRPWRSATGKLPFLPGHERSTWQLIGRAYVQGVMQGEFEEQRSLLHLEPERIILI